MSYDIQQGLWLPKKVRKMVIAMVDRIEERKQELGYKIVNSWGAFADPSMIKQRRWGWYAWIECPDYKLGGNRIATSLGFGNAFDCKMSEVNVDMEDYLKDADPITKCIRNQMAARYKFRTFMATTEKYQATLRGLNPKC